MSLKAINWEFITGLKPINYEFKGYKLGVYYR